MTLPDAPAPGAKGRGERLDVVLSARLPGLSRSAAQRLVREGAVRVNGAVVRKPSWRVVKGDEVGVDIPSVPAAPTAAAGAPVQIVYEDEHIIVLDKPAGVPVHPGPGHREGTLVQSLLLVRPEIAGVGEPDRPGVVHRLDLGTSGLLIFARTQPAYLELVRMIKAREVRRTYTALVAGAVEPAEGIIDAPIGRDPAQRTRQAVVGAGKPARTRYRVIRLIELPANSGGGTASLLEVTLETGRMHQIRVHMTAIGHPVLGDRVYGGRAPSLSGLGRQFLHAARLEFRHPVTGSEVAVESELPRDLADALRGEVLPAAGR